MLREGGNNSGSMTKLGLKVALGISLPILVGIADDLKHLKDLKDEKEEKGIAVDQVNPLNKIYPGYAIKTLDLCKRVLIDWNQYLTNIPQYEEKVPPRLYDVEYLINQRKIKQEENTFKISEDKNDRDTAATPTKFHSIILYSHIENCYRSDSSFYFSTTLDKDGNSTLLIPTKEDPSKDQNDAIFNQLQPFGEVYVAIKFPFRPNGDYEFIHKLGFEIWVKKAKEFTKVEGFDHEINPNNFIDYQAYVSTLQTFLKAFRFYQDSLYFANEESKKQAQVDKDVVVKDTNYIQQLVARVAKIESDDRSPCYAVNTDNNTLAPISCFRTSFMSSPMQSFTLKDFYGHKNTTTWANLSSLPVIDQKFIVLPIPFNVKNITTTALILAPGTYFVLKLDGNKPQLIPVENFGNAEDDACMDVPPKLEMFPVVDNRSHWVGYVSGESCTLPTQYDEKEGYTLHTGTRVIRFPKNY